MAQLEDFGEKIGGARKDLWKLTGITSLHFSEMNEMERATHVKKDNIWIKPDWEKLIAEGTPQAVAYWQNKMRQSLPPKPPEATEEVQERYISIVSAVRDAVMAVKDQYEIRNFYKSFIGPEYTQRIGYRLAFKEEAEGIITNKVLKAAQMSYSRLLRDAEKNLFGIPKEDKAYVQAKQGLEIYCFDGENVQLAPDSYDSSTNRLTIRTGWSSSYYYLREKDKFHDIDQWEKGTWFVLGKNSKPLRINMASREEAESFIDSYARAAQIAAEISSASKDKDDSNSNRKKNFVPPQLAHVRYTGPDVRNGRLANGQMFLDDLKFRGGEFGNWLNENDRQTNLNMAYDALHNLSHLLKVPPEDISLNGQLAIAFGARGKGGASAGAAHYEPLRQVINLTKMSGAGCLAHEWAHALDHAIGLSAGIQGFATEAKGTDRRKLPASFDVLMNKLLYKETVIGADELQKEIDPQIRHAKQNLHNWIASAKPTKLPEDLSKAWDDIEKRILENPESFTGGEYMNTMLRAPVLTHPDVEQLSQIRKWSTNHVIPKDTKIQIALWARDLKRLNEQVKTLAATKKQVKTDFYKGSIEFDNIYSKSGHGYWQSRCEMFARAFDCYIADKVKEQGYRSDYLSSNSDSFYIPKGDGVIAAYPVGEERQVINQAFDDLLAELKERGILHDVPEIEPVLEAAPPKPSHSAPEPHPSEPDKPVHYEQLSLDEMLFSAASRAGQGTSGKQTRNPYRSR